ncbi:MAG: hypothetical protein ACYDEP_08795 [Acidimicrobiales bacterium]
MGDLYVWIYNNDVTNTDTWFDICLGSPNPGNQCQAATLTYNQTIQANFPGADAATVFTGWGTGNPAASSQYNVNISAVSDLIWSMFNQDYAGTPSYNLYIGTDNGTISQSNVTNAVQTAAYSPNAGCNPPQTVYA